jgi:polyisoprenoid-binding protein YceI
MLQRIFIASLFALMTVTAQANKSASKNLSVSAQDSKVEWSGTKKIGSGHKGIILLDSGSVTIENNMIKSGQITVNLQTIEVLDIPKTDENNKKLTDHLRSADFFDVDKFPKAKLVIKSSKKMADDQYEVMGDLTIKETTLPVTIPVKISMTDKETVATGNLKIDRTKFGIKYGSGNFFKLAADRIINDEFELTFKVVAK